MKTPLEAYETAEKEVGSDSFEVHMKGLYKLSNFLNTIRTLLYD